MKTKWIKSVFAINSFAKAVTVVATIALFLVGSIVWVVSGPYATLPSAGSPGLTVLGPTVPPDTESAAYGAEAIRQIKHAVLHFATNRHQLSGDFKTNSIQSYHYGSNSIPASAFTSNSISAFMITNLTQNSGFILQVARTNSSVITTNSTPIPKDDTIPQSDEGDQWASITMTPLSSNSVIILRVGLHGRIAGNSLACVTLFQDSATNAIHAAAFSKGSGGEVGTYTEKSVAASTTNSRTYKIRLGPLGGSGSDAIYVNLGPASETLGGVFTSYFEAQERAP